MKGFWTAIVMLTFAYLTRYPFKTLTVAVTIGFLIGWLV